MSNSTKFSNSFLAAVQELSTQHYNQFLTTITTVYYYHIITSITIVIIIVYFGFVIIVYIFIRLAELDTPGNRNVAHKQSLLITASTLIWPSEYDLAYLVLLPFFLPTEDNERRQFLQRWTLTGL